ncbi:MAG: hypothetical protein K0Q73_8448 [Paenibacillus sp.]|jgi:hypothetical protein|nr:hypothetical protein [Paenibacillus sp.]
MIINPYNGCILQTLTGVTLGDASEEFQNKSNWKNMCSSNRSDLRRMIICWTYEGSCIGGGNANGARTRRKSLSESIRQALRNLVLSSSLADTKSSHT